MYFLLREFDMEHIVQQVYENAGKVHGSIDCKYHVILWVEAMLLQNCE